MIVCTGNKYQEVRVVVKGFHVIETRSFDILFVVSAYKREQKGKKDAAEKKKREKEQNTSKEGEEAAGEEIMEEDVVEIDDGDD